MAEEVIHEQVIDTAIIDFYSDFLFLSEPVRPAESTDT